MGKLIVIEGLDGSGKSTQLQLLEKSLQNIGARFRTLSFPNYDSPAAAPLKMYLGGEFGKNPDDVNAYAASILFTVDRFASFKTTWEDFYGNGGILLSARYTTSNVIHQASKLPKESWDEYIDWLYEFEFNKVKIPKPDLVIFLDMPNDISSALISSRYGGDEAKRDIHENNREYLQNCRDVANYACKKLNWKIVPCAKDGKPRLREEISADILKLVKDVIK